jgi:hypothetical protein
MSWLAQLPGSLSPVVITLGAEGLDAVAIAELNRQPPLGMRGGVAAYGYVGKADGGHGANPLGSASAFFSLLKAGGESIFDAGYRRLFYRSRYGNTVSVWAESALCELLLM